MLLNPIARRLAHIIALTALVGACNDPPSDGEAGDPPSSGGADASTGSDARAGDARAGDARAGDARADDDGGATGGDANASDARGDDASADDAGDPLGSTCPVDHSGPFADLSVPPGAPLDRLRSDPLPSIAGNATVPTGWKWYTIDGAVCRDGSPTGFYVRYGTANNLLIYLEGGGACDTAGFCGVNPSNISQHFNAGGETVLGSIGWAQGIQAPGTSGIFNTTKSENPFRDYSQIYVPYCTGDVHFGTRKDVTVPGLSGAQQFVGAFNMKKFVARWTATFAGVQRVVLAGSSAGGFGVGLNYGLVQDSFGKVPVWAIDDSGPPLGDAYIPPCLQKIWRNTWGLDAALPADCTECRKADGGGLMDILTYWRRKYVSSRVAFAESVHDEVIRLFFAAGNDNCANAVNADPVAIVLGTLGTTYDANKFQAGLMDVRDRQVCSNQLATYYINKPGIDTLHQILFRDRFYEVQASSGTTTVAKWTQDFLDGKMTQVGP